MPRYLKEMLNAELALLDNESVEIDGKQLKPSQCYRLSADPSHILFNTNCPDELRRKLQNIISKYLPVNEDRS
jgi:hypothetical protein